MNRKILIVDDEMHIRMLLSQTLEDMVEDDDVELLFADNGETALELIQQQQPRLVILDVMMPKMNGMDVCGKVKNELGKKDIYIVLLTAKGQEVDRKKGSEVGADQYMTKPFDPDELLKMAREVLNLPA